LPTKASITLAEQIVLQLSLPEIATSEIKPSDCITTPRKAIIPTFKTNNPRFQAIRLPPGVIHFLLSTSLNDPTKKTIQLEATQKNI
jgi:hypothetical protein